MIRKILQSGDPVLRKKAKKVVSVDKKIKDLIRDMKDTLKVQKDPEGVGLAAPQIGKSLQIFVADYKNFQRVVVNPEVIKIVQNPKSLKTKKTKNEILEGCLSLPYYYGPLKRAGSVTLKYLNEEGIEVIETFTGFDAQIILHEVDHLNGVLFVDRLLEEKKPLYKVDGHDWEEVELI